MPHAHICKNKILHATFLHVPRPADSDPENSLQLAGPKNPQKCVQYAITSLLGLGTADSSLNNPACLNIHLNAVFYIPLLPGKKFHATSQFGLNLTNRLLAK